MKVLIVTARFPELGMKGDQMRSLQHAELLAPDHEVTVMTAGQPSSPERAAALERLGTLRPIRLGRRQRAAGAIGALVRGKPMQVGWMMPRSAHAQLAAAASEYDVVIAVTIRCLLGRLPAPTVLDHVDALSGNMRQRAGLERNPALKLAAFVEGKLLARHERWAAGWIAAQTVVSPIDAKALPSSPPPVVMPLVLEVDEVDSDRERDIDVILTGDMRYPPNRQAAQWLAAEIAPELRRLRPEARVVVAGRAADSLGQLPDVEVMSDVPDMAALLERSRLAAVPLRSGTGTPIKLLEAAGRGAAPVATPWVAEALGIDIETAADGRSFAAALSRLLADEPERVARVEAAREGLLRCRPETVRAQLTEIVDRATRSVGAPT